MSAARAASLPSSAAWHGVDPPSRSLLRRAKEGRPESVPPRPGLPVDRRGRLKNGNRSGDFLAAPRCGAHTRCGGSCRQPAMANGRCRMHGGLSTGPRTPEGLTRSRRARWKHGARSAAVRALLREACLQSRRTRALRARVAGSSAGHGVHRTKSNSPGGAHRARPSSSTRASSSTTLRVNDARARAARPYTGRSDGVVSAGHGVHRPTSQPKPIGVHGRNAERFCHPRPPVFAKSASSLRSRFGGVSSAGEGRSAADPSSPAWHGVLRSFATVCAHRPRSAPSSLC